MTVHPGELNFGMGISPHNKLHAKFPQWPSRFKIEELRAQFEVKLRLLERNYCAAARTCKNTNGR